MKLTEEFLKFHHKDIPEEKLKELKISYDYLQEAFLMVCDTSSKRAKQIVCSVDLEMVCFFVSVHLSCLFKGNSAKTLRVCFYLFIYFKSVYKVHA